MRQEYDPPNLTTAPLQEIFDYICRFLRTQGEKSGVIVQRFNIDGKMEPFFECRYRYEKPTGDILRCGAGCCLPDANYKPSIENISVLAANVAPRFFGDAGSEVYRKHYNKLRLLKEMQQVHDTFAMDCWEEHWRRVASAFQLNYKGP